MRKIIAHLLEDTLERDIAWDVVELECYCVFWIDAGGFERLPIWVEVCASCLLHVIEDRRNIVVVEVDGDWTAQLIHRLLILRSLLEA